MTKTGWIITILPSGLAIAKPVYAGKKQVKREEDSQELENKLDDPRRGQAKYINREWRKK